MFIHVVRTAYTTFVVKPLRFKTRYLRIPFRKQTSLTNGRTELYTQTWFVILILNVSKRKTQNLVSPVTDRQTVRLKTLIQTCNCLRNTFVWLLSKLKISRTVNACQLLTLFDKINCVLQNGKSLC